MSSYVQPNVKAFKSGSDLSAKQYHFVKLDTDSKTVIAAGAGDKAIGVLMNAPGSAVGSDCEVALLGGGALLKVAAVLALGGSVQSDANGQGVAGATGVWSPAISMEISAINDVIHVLLDGHYQP